ncbi:MAG: GNAT family N-acetyltransferase [Deltaproteobacteria bacterium]|nr:GNAT family N-acetyltransferase [Deltaproteobacteria bacterium]
MRIRSLALTTELALANTRGRVTDRGDYLVVETPDDPGYFYGNMLVLPAAPQVGEVNYWTRRFAEHLPGLAHVTLWWDGITGDAGAESELVAAGFTIERALVMTAEAIANTEAPLPVRTLAADEITDTLPWALADRHDESYRQFLLRRAAWQRSLVARGLATWVGAFDGAQLVASLGLVELGTIGRYQDVATLPAYRGRGLASALLHAAAKATSVERVVVLTEKADLYERAGFRIIERTASACRYPPGVSARSSRSR